MRSPRQEGQTLLVSGFGERSGGGIFALSDHEPEQLDRTSTTGLAIGDGRVARLLRSATEVYGSELLLYDAAGIKRYIRLDEVVDPHDIVWDGSTYVVASTAANSVFWLSPSGDVVRRWNAPGHGDAWHLNSLLVDGGRLYAAAFGRFERHREWSSTPGEPTGFVFDVGTGENVIGGLSCPHHPRRLDDSWLVCNSGTSELLELDPAGTIGRRLDLGGWTRGLAVTERFFYVGVSVSRNSEDPAATASVAVVSRNDWTVSARVPVPCDEVYDVVLAPEPLVQGVRRGFRTNPVRTAEQDQFVLFEELGVRPTRIWATGDALPPEACRVTLDARVPREIGVDSWHELDCSVENLGTGFLVSAPPHPVHLSYRWLRDGVSEEGARSRLPRAIPPRARADCRLGVAAPSAPGIYELRVTLVQEGVAWFDDLDARNAWSAHLRVS